MPRRVPFISASCPTLVQFTLTAETPPIPSGYFCASASLQSWSLPYPSWAACLDNNSGSKRYPGARSIMVVAAVAAATVVALVTAATTTKQ